METILLVLLAELIGLTVPATPILTTVSVVCTQLTIGSFCIALLTVHGVNLVQHVASFTTMPAVNARLKEIVHVPDHRNGKKRSATSYLMKICGKQVKMT